VKKRMILRFSKNRVDKPVVYRLARDYGLVFNILRANILPRADSFMVIEVEGEEGQFERGMDYLRSQAVEMEPIEQDIARDEERCVHCGLCTSVCTPRALYIEEKGRKVLFDYERCVACEMCVRVCPVKAMNVFFAP